MQCPNCGEQCERDEVDVGVGVECGPWGCSLCGWSEYHEYNQLVGNGGLQEDGGYYDPMGGYYPPSNLVAAELQKYSNGEGDNNDGYTPNS